MRESMTTTLETRPQPAAMITLLKPITWFPPMWAFTCGIVSGGGSLSTDFFLIIAGIMLCGPLVCGTSQAVNDWFDRHVDAINEPDRPIPSGRIPGNWGLYIAIIWTAVSMLVAYQLGTWVFNAAVVGMLLAWAYSAPPFRLKQNGWWGNTACAVCYEGLPWFTGAALMTSVLPDSSIIILALLYSAGAHGIMTLNDFKAIEGDKHMGVKSLPVQLGAERAAKLACIVMALPQVVVVALLFKWGLSVHAFMVSIVLVVQVALMSRLLKKPRELAPWYNATGISLYVTGMMISAFGIRSMVLA